MAAPLLLLAVALAGNPLTSDPEIKSGLGLLDKLEYDRAVVVLGRALTRPDLPKVDRVAGLEALAFAYTILDDRVHADETFCELLDVYPEYLGTVEREILKLVAESNSTKEIAQKLGISVKTVDNHRTNLMRKLNLHDVASLTRYAIGAGIIESCVQVTVEDPGAA